MKTVVVALAALLSLASTATAQTYGFYWLYVEGNWKSSHKGQADCEAVGAASGKAYDCRPVQVSPGAGAAGGQSKWEADVQYCKNVSGLMDAYVSGPGETQMLGSTAARYAFSKCLTERGHRLK